MGKILMKMNDICISFINFNPFWKNCYNPIFGTELFFLQAKIKKGLKV